MKAFAIMVLSISCAWAIFLLLRVKSFMGTKFLVISGSNIFDTKGIQLSEGVLFFLWLVPLAGIGTGIFLLIKSAQSSSSINRGQGTGPSILDTKKCPKCAETIKLEAKVCKHCGEEFSEEEIDKKIGSSERTNTGFIADSSDPNAIQCEGCDQFFNKDFKKVFGSQQVCPDCLEEKRKELGL